MAIWLLRTMLYLLLLTVLLELLFARWYGVRGKKDLGLVLLVNILTNPVVVLTYELLDCYTQANMLLVTVLLELAAILVEGSYFKRYGKNIQRPVCFAFCVNLFSYGTGLLLDLLI